MVDFVEKIFDELRQDGLPLLLTLSDEKAILKLGFKTERAARSAVFRCIFPLQLFSYSGITKFKLVDMARLLAGEAAPANFGPPSSQSQNIPANTQSHRPRGRPRKAFRSGVNGGVQ